MSKQDRNKAELFATELANLRTAFRWATDHGDLDTAVIIASCAGWIGYLTENSGRHDEPRNSLPGAAGGRHRLQGIRTHRRAGQHGPGEARRQRPTNAAGGMSLWGLPGRSHGDLVGDVDRGVGGVVGARCDVDGYVVAHGQCALTGPLVTAL